MLRGLVGVGLLAAVSAYGRDPCDRGTVTRAQALWAAERLGIDWSRVDFTPEDLRRGMVVELEHGPCGPGGRRTNVTRGSLFVTAQIAYAHLLERANYYELLQRYVEVRARPW